MLLDLLHVFIFALKLFIAAWFNPILYRALSCTINRVSAKVNLKPPRLYKECYRHAKLISLITSLFSTNPNSFNAFFSESPLKIFTLIQNNIDHFQEP